MESNTEVTIRFDSKFRIFAQHYIIYVTKEKIRARLLS